FVAAGRGAGLLARDISTSDTKRVRSYERGAVARSPDEDEATSRSRLRSSESPVACSWRLPHAPRTRANEIAATFTSVRMEPPLEDAYIHRRTRALIYACVALHAMRQTQTPFERRIWGTIVQRW